VPSSPTTTPTIRVRRSPVHGLGAFAAKALSAGEHVGIYEGRRYTALQAARRDWNSELTYLFSLSDGSMIDGAEGGNATRHLNHSCTPNVVAYEEKGERRRKVIVFYAMRDIRAGEELLLDYGLDVDASADPSSFGCACGSPECRGTMLAIAA
jgi:SET domain-containing protein